MTDDIAPDAPASEVEAAPAPRPRSKTVLFIVAGLAIGGALGPLVVGPAFANSKSKDHAKSVAGAHEPVGGEQGAPHLLENLVVNPADSRGTRFLLVSVGIQMSDAAAEADIKARDTQVRDHILQVLGAKSIDELVDIRRRGDIRQEIAVSLDSLLGEGKVRAVFFPQFVIQ